MRRADDLEVGKVMAGAPFLEDVPRKALDRFATEGAVHRFRRGTYLCHQGDPDGDVFFLVTGRVEISSETPNGNRVLHATLDTPGFVGELSSLGKMPRTASVLTLDDSDVWSISSDSFVDFVTSEPTASRAFLQALARQVREHQSFSDDLLYLDLKGRVAKRLLQLVTPSLDDLPSDGVVVPAVTHADLASLCGGSRENVTRILTEWQRRGLIERDGHRYVLKKVAGLAKIADL
ncbi:MAG TPA: Crp/Fnr family transcriptional regulator [Actinomycetota bacterium]|jgi:CRP/FNR family transcriptional regulator/CRP/FNR family cyclic AMP-dependent transcriptional regulator|nr:Crp/Fnr family transcriptional regulator [Actinomycetota bacterium]